MSENPLCGRFFGIENYGVKNAPFMTCTFEGCPMAMVDKVASKIVHGEEFGT